MCVLSHAILFVGSLAKSVRKSTRYKVGSAQNQRRPTGQSSHSKFITKLLSPPARNDKVCSAPCRRDTGRVYWIAIEIEAATKEQDRWEKHGQFL